MVAGGGSKTEATVTIRARCSGVPGGTGDGDTADMESWVNGEYEATFEGLTGSWVLYTDTVALSGDDRVEVVHPNPECSTGTRSLYVDWVEVDSQRVQMEGGSVVFDEGSDTDAFDGLDVEDPDASLTSVRLQVDGALRFVVGENARALCYDQNGNACTERSRSVTWRLREGAAIEQQWNADNRLTYVKDWGELAIITFTYDANGVLLARETPTATTVDPSLSLRTGVGGIYERNLTTGERTKYYFFSGQRVAMKKANTLSYLTGDHLGTTSVVIKSNGTLGAESRHYPYG